MARALKKLAPHQLLASGTDGFYSGHGVASADERATAKNPQPANMPTWFVHEGTDYDGTDVRLRSLDLASSHLHPKESTKQ